VFAPLGIGTIAQLLIEQRHQHLSKLLDALRLVEAMGTGSTSESQENQPSLRIIVLSDGQRVNYDAENGERGWHATSSLGSIGAAATAARLLGQDAGAATLIEQVALSPAVVVREVLARLEDAEALAVMRAAHPEGTIDAATAAAADLVRFLEWAP